MSLQFTDLNLESDLLNQVARQGYTQPTPIQAQAIPILLEGQDLIAQAQTGTGKTAAFILPMLQKIDCTQPYIQALVLLPTRELAIQVAQSVKNYGGSKTKSKSCLIYGGQSIQAQIKKLADNPIIVIGTPGRIIDHIQRGHLDLSQIQYMVLDEADEMLKMGFLQDVKLILDQTPDDKQSALFSATLPKEMKSIAKSYLKPNHKLVKVQESVKTSLDIDQSYILIQMRNKVELLSALIELEIEGSILIFTKTRRDTTYLADRLQARGHSAEALNGEMNQNLRETVLNRLRFGRLKVLIATDVAARGLDVNHISLVINYEIPHDKETYIHRIGRTGRAGKSGRSISLVTFREWSSLQSLQHRLNINIHKIEPPTPEEILQARSYKLTSELRDSLVVIKEKTKDDMSAYHRVLDQVSNPNDDMKDLLLAALNLLTQKKTLDRNRLPKRLPCLDPPKPREARSSTILLKEGYTLIQLHEGKKRGIRPKDIVGAIANEAQVDGSLIGAIRIELTRTLIEVPENLAHHIIETLNGKSICGAHAFLSFYTHSSQEKPNHQKSYIQAKSVDQGSIASSSDSTDKTTTDESHNAQQGNAVLLNKKIELPSQKHI